MGKKLRPGHAAWPCISARVKPGRVVFPAHTAQNGNATSKAVFSKIGLDYAQSYPSRGFRRGASQEIKEKGALWSAVATAGGWRSLALLGYVDLTRDVDRAMSKLLPETDPMDSGDDKVHRWVQGPASGLRSTDGR